MKYQNVTDMPAVAPVQMPEGRQFLHTRTAGIEVPFGQSMVTALIFGLTVFVVAWACDIIDPWKHGLIAAMLGLCGWWMYSLMRWSSLTKRETLYVEARGVDDDDDPATPMVVRVQLDRVEANGHIHQTAIFDLPASPEQLSALAGGLLDGHPFSEREWTGAGHPFSVNEFRTLRSELIRRKLLALKNDKDPRQGYGLTDDGKAVFEQFLP